MNTKRFDIKAIQEDGTFEGWLSLYGVTDLVGDIVEPGAFTKNIQEHGTERVLLWQHDPASPIGTIDLEERDEGLWVKGKLLLAVQKAREAYALIKAGVISGLSIGFRPIKKQMADGVRRLKEIELAEGSIVTFPALPTAQIEAVKALMAEKAADPMTACQALCSMCADACRSTIYYCYDAGGKMLSEAHIGALRDCIYGCEMTANAVSRGSASLEAICALCETLCKACESACRAFADDAVMQSCADTCASCAMAVGAVAMPEEGKSAEPQVSAPVEPDAGNATPVETKQKESEPAVDHSALVARIDSLKGHLQWNRLK